ncbi:MAG: hypothetical protein PHC51_08790 [bacterium]|nr:hypothetical protein [bacterium]
MNHFSITAGMRMLLLAFLLVVTFTVDISAEEPAWDENSIPKVEGLDKSIRYDVKDAFASGVKVEITPLFTLIPNKGFLPVKIALENNTTRKQSWSLSYKQNESLETGYNYNTILSAEAGTRSSFYISVPLPTGKHPEIATQGSYFNSGSDISISGYGYSKHTTNLSPAQSGKRGLIALSSALFSASRATLDWRQVLEKKPSYYNNDTDFSVTAVDLSDFPANWKSFSGLDSLWLEEKEWKTLDSSLQEAIYSWVSFGGNLILVGSDTALGKIISGSQLNSLPSGLGKITRIYSNGTITLGDFTAVYGATPAPVDNSSCADNTKVTAKPESPETASTITPTTPLMKPLTEILPAREKNKGLEVLVLFAVFIFISPYPLFRRWRSNQHWRLAFDIPIYSVILSLAVATYCVFSYGIGGNGVRGSFIFLPAERHEAWIREELVSNTGVIFKRNLPLTDESMLGCYSLETDYGPTLRGDLSFEREAQTVKGECLANNTRRFHLLERLVPSRARLKLENYPAMTLAHAPPVVSSEINTELKRVVLFSSEKGCWSADNLAPGQSLSLDEQPEDWCQSWLKQIEPRLPSIKAIRGSGLPDNVYRYIALADRSPEKLQEISSEVNWQNLETVIAGEIVVAQDKGVLRNEHFARIDGSQSTFSYLRYEKVSLY